MSKWCRFVWCVACWAGVVAGCDDGSARDSQCNRICEKRELCDSHTDEMDCIDSCLSQGHLSDAFVSEWAGCVAPDSVSCDKAMDEIWVDDCVTDALRAQDPSELLEDVCTALASKLAACEDGVDPLSVRSACLRGDALKLSDDYLERSRSCVDSLCEELDDCFEDLADDNNTDLSIVPLEGEGEREDRERAEASSVPELSPEGGFSIDADAGASSDAD